MLDSAFLLEHGLNPEKAKTAINGVFRIRSTHLPPPALPEPPASWYDVFPTLAKESRVNLSLAGAFESVDEFYRNLR